MKRNILSRSIIPAMLLAACCLLAVNGCKQIDLDPVFALSLHEYVDPGEQIHTNLHVRVTSADGSQTRVIRRIPILDWHRFDSAELLPDDDGIHAGLKLHIDISGRRLWQQITGYRKGNKIAIVMDGLYVGESMLPKRFDEVGETYETAHLWSVAEAKTILENIHRNY